jgi:hypothetical protein
MNTDHNILNEDDNLNEMAPTLSKLRSKDPFFRSERNPDAANDYFNSFGSRLQSRMEDLDELEANAPTLLSIGKSNSFVLPPDYFDELPSRIQERIQKPSNSSSITEWLLLLINPRFAFPMIAILFLAVAGINFMNKNAELNATTPPNELSLEDHLYYIEESDIIEQLTENMSSDNSIQSENEKNIEDYLLDNDVDESNLNNEL